MQLAKWQGAEVIAVAAGRHETFYVSSARIALSTIQPPQWKRRCVTWTWSLMRRAGRPAAVFAYPATRRRAVPIFPLGFAGAEEARQRGVTVSTTQVRSSGAQLARLADLLDAGVIQVAIDSVFPLAQVQMAHERAAQGHLEGKIVLSVMDSSAG